MMKYLLLIEEKKEWQLFKQNYRKAGIGTNLNQAIEFLIKKFNQR